MTHHSVMGRFAEFFKDKDGNVVVWQRPNFPLVGWLVFKIISMLLSTGTAKTWSTHLSMALLFTWAYLEITSGSSYFRRVLGAVIIAGLLMSFRR